MSSKDKLDSLLMPPPPKRQKRKDLAKTSGFHANGAIDSFDGTAVTKSNTITFESFISMEEEGSQPAQCLGQVSSDVIDESCNEIHLDRPTFGIKKGSMQKLQKRKKEMFDKPPIKQRFSDIIGHAPAKLRLDEMLLPLALPPGLSNSILSGVRSAPLSILLYGPPGTGKTQLAKAVAGEAQAAFISVGPSDVLSKFVGESEASIKKLFKEAYDKAKRMESRCTILFFDEIDALGQSRGDGDSNSSGQGGSGNNSRRILAELLIQMTKLSSEQVDDSPCNTDEEYDGDSFVGEDIDDQQCIETYDYVDLKLKNKGNMKLGEGYVPETFVESENTSEEFAETASTKSTRIISPSSPNEHSTIITKDANDPTPIDASKGENQISSPRKSLESNQSCRKQEQMLRPRVLVVAATNRPEDCDPALLRRFGVRVLVGLPTARDRRRIIERFLSDIKHTISRSQMSDLAASTDGWSGSDLESLTREAVMAPIRECLRETAVMKIETRKKKRRRKSTSTEEDESDTIDENELARDFLLARLENLRSVTLDDFENAARFWMGNSQHQHIVFGGSGGMCHESHYDTHSDSDTEADDISIPERNSDLPQNFDAVNIGPRDNR